MFWAFDHQGTSPALSGPGSPSSVLFLPTARSSGDQRICGASLRQQSLVWKLHTPRIHCTNQSIFWGTVQVYLVMSVLIWQLQFVNSKPDLSNHGTAVVREICLWLVRWSSLLLTLISDLSRVSQMLLFIIQQQRMITVVRCGFGVESSYNPIVFLCNRPPLCERRRLVAL